MNRFLVTFFLILFLLSTVLICVFKPKTHKQIVFENKNFELSMITEKAESDKKDININIEPPYIEMPEIEVPEVSIKLPESQPKTTQPKQQKPAVQKPQKTQTAKTQNTPKPQPAKQETKTPKTTTPPVVKKEEPKTEVQKPKQEVVEPKKEPPKEQPKPQTVQQPVPKPVKVLTEEEEIIAWNKWRSDLQNKLMRDSKISAPVGTSFMFSFTVDKNGNISNLRTWSSNPSYNSLAVNVIKPLLLSYQKTAILKFPEGSKRIITNANGGFTMAHSTRYSSPSDYNDYERVRK